MVNNLLIISKLKKLDRVYIATIACFILLMYVSKVSANASQYIWLITNNLVGVAVTFIMLAVYPVKDFLRPFYIIWTVLGIAGTIGGYFFWYAHQVDFLVYACVTVPLNIWFLGAVVFKYIEEVFIRKSFKITISKWEPVYIVCMLLMVLSLSNTFWPFYYLIIFLLLWHTPFSHEQRHNVLVGIVDGLIVGIAILQCYAFIYTPYLEVRYIGVYNNCNRNSCLYLVALVALLAKKHIYRVSHAGDVQEKNEKAGKELFIFDCFTALIFAFIFYTGSRTGILGAALIMLIYYFFSEYRFFKSGIKKLTVKTAVYLAMALVMVPILYFPIRYLPEIRPFVRVVAKNIIKGTDAPFHPVGGVDFRSAVTYPFERFFESNRRASVEEEETIDEQTSVSEIDDENVQVSEVVEIEPDPSGRCYTLKYDFMYYPERGWFTVRVPKNIYIGLNTIDCRINIAAALIDQMNFVGHKDNEIILRIWSDVPSTYEVFSNNEQNIALHYLYVYGVPIGMLVLILMLAEVVYLIRRSLGGKSDGTVFLLLVSVYFIFGITEIVWVPGQIEQLLLFFAPLFFDSFDSAVAD